MKSIKLIFYLWREVNFECLIPSLMNLTADDDVSPNAPLNLTYLCHEMVVNSWLQYELQIQLAMSYN